MHLQNEVFDRLNEGCLVWLLSALNLKGESTVAAFQIILEDIFEYWVSI